MRPETSGFLGSNPLIHSYSLFLHLPLYPCSPPHSFILSPSPLIICQAHVTEKRQKSLLITGLCPVPFHLSPHFPARGGRLGAGEGLPDTAQDPQILNLDPEPSFPGLPPLPRAHLPLGLGSITPQE